MASTRTFETGATRNDDSERIDPEGFFSPVVLEEFCNYMHKNRYRENGEMRDSDNWQLGITQRAYAKSLWRHMLDFMKTHRAVGNNKEQSSPYRNEQLVSDCCALMFNAMGYLFEELKKPTKEAKMQELYAQQQAALQQMRHYQSLAPTFIGGLAGALGVGRQADQSAYGRVQSPFFKAQLMEDLNEPGYGSGV